MIQKILHIDLSVKLNYYMYRIGSYIRESLILPEQTATDIKIFKKVFHLYAGKKLRIFEWGAGRSTIYYSRYLLSIGCDFEWHSIDNSRIWKENIERLVARYKLTDRVYLHLSEFPAFWELPGWSWSKIEIPEDICSPEVVEYVEYPKNIAGDIGFDIVIIDGRFRRRCLLETPKIVAPK